MVVGKAERLSTLEVVKYFHSRPRDSQIGAWVSQQSSRISARGILESKFLELKQKFQHGEVPLPSFWGDSASLSIRWSSGRAVNTVCTIVFYTSATMTRGKSTAWLRNPGNLLC